MRWTNIGITTTKEAPVEAELISHQLLLRAAYIKKMSQGIFVYGHLALRVIRNLENIIRQELDKANAVEISMPMVQSADLWKSTGRWDKMGDTMLRFKNRTQQEFCLGPTHEEVVTEYIKPFIKSYKNLPLNFYQIQTKYRDEIRPRFGLMRGREFIMKDGYSFDTSAESAQKSYDSMYKVYQNIFNRLGVSYRIVQADTGDIGGNQSHEFHLLAESGEDILLVSDTSDFAANSEICKTLSFLEKQNFAKSEDKDKESKKDLTKLDQKLLSTPNIKSIKDLSKFLNLKKDKLVKTLFFNIKTTQVEKKEVKQNIEKIVVLVRGDHDINTYKLKNFFKALEVSLLTEEEVIALTGANPGSCGPINLKEKIKIYADFSIEKMINYTVGANKNDYHIQNVNNSDFICEGFFDFRLAVAGDLSPDGKGRLVEYKGIEAGHIFYLGTTYSKKLKAEFLDSNGKTCPVEMGCYGLGVSRLVQAIVEQSHDENGIIWPMILAPYKVHICLLDPKDEEISKLCDDIYKDLISKGVSVLLDDRKERPGFKFKDADLLGMPLRLTFGARSLKEGGVELVERKTQEKQLIKLNEVVETILKKVKQ
ncbi:MAG: proline--tRNA ligase [Bdellovibrionales bacterium]|nr:proline--tRNA ligase [Bdellovibrionales bacterium]